MCQQEPAIGRLQPIFRAAQGEMCTCLFLWCSEASPPSRRRLEVLTPWPSGAPSGTSPGTCKCFPSPLPPSSLSPGVLSPLALLSSALPPHHCRPDLPVLLPQPCCRSKEVFDYYFPPNMEIITPDSPSLGRGWLQRVVYVWGMMRSWQPSDHL